jgi:outer membrane putative beta-barrel porin/alpha-amylase
MSKKLTTLAAAGLLSLSAAAPALAGSVTQPGETVGVAAGAPLPPGVYYVNTSDYGCRDTQPATVCTALTIPVVAWSTPVTLLGARLQFLVASPAVFVAVEDTPSSSGMFNPLVSGQLAWDLGNGWGFSYLLGAYLDVHTNVAFSSTSINQRFALSYTNDGWNLTANVIWGIHLDGVTDRPQLSPCPTPFGLNGCNPNFVNIDLTATKKIDKWEFGPVAFGSTDLNRPIAAYQKQSQFAVGGLIGYDFGPLTLQGYVTTDVVENNYGGRDIRGWGRIILPISKIFEQPARAPIVRKY